MLNASTESVNCSLFLKNLEKHLCNWIYKKNFSKHIKNLPQHLSEKFSGDNLSITDIALEIEIYRLSVSHRAFWKLSIIVIALAQKGLSCPSLPVDGIVKTELKRTCGTVQQYHKYLFWNTRLRFRVVMQRACTYHDGFILRNVHKQVARIEETHKTIDLPIQLWHVIGNGERVRNAAYCVTV